MYRHEDYIRDLLYELQEALGDEYTITMTKNKKKIKVRK